MATHLFEHRADPPRNRLAWFASLAAHAGALAVLGYISWATFRGGESPRPAGDAGFVLGLSSGEDEQAPREKIYRMSGDSESADAGLGNGPAAEAAFPRPIPAVEDGGELIAPAPRLPMLALGTSGPSSAASAPPATARGPLRVGAVADRATVTVFGARGEGTRFVYLFDHSTSMAGLPLAAAKHQLIASLDALSSVHQFQVIFFNHEVQAWDLTGGQGRIPFASDRNKQLAAQFVQNVAAIGGTDRLAPLRRALAMNADVVFFLTDADDAMAAYEVAEVIERAQRSSTAIACIEFGDGPQPEGANFLTQLAEAPAATTCISTRRGCGEFFESLTARLRRRLRLCRPPRTADVVHAELGRILRPRGRVPDAGAKRRRTRIVPRELVIDARHAHARRAPAPVGLQLSRRRHDQRGRRAVVRVRVVGVPVVHRGASLRPHVRLGRRGVGVRQGDDRDGHRAGGDQTFHRIVPCARGERQAVVPDGGVTKIHTQRFGLVA